MIPELSVTSSISVLAPRLGLAGGGAYDLKIQRISRSSHVWLPEGPDDNFLLVADLVSLSAANAMSGEAGIRYVIGHELAHIASLSQSPTAMAGYWDATIPIKDIELLADFGSGYAFVPSVAEQSARSPVARTVIALADYGFSQPDHHGTVFERVSAFGMGAHAAERNYPLDFERLAGRLTLFKESLTVRRSNDAAAVREQFEANLERLLD